MPEPLPLLARWAHILAAITLLGGGIFVRFALLPAVRDHLSDDQRNQLRNGVLKRWKMFVHTAIFLLLASGLYNYMVLTRPLHDGQALYHALVGTKMLLALIVFVLVIMATLSGTASREIQAKSPALLLGAVVLGISIVLLSGFVGRMEETSPAASSYGQVIDERTP